MKQKLLYLAAAAMLTACSSDLENIGLETQTEDIRFAVSGINASPVSVVGTRAGEHQHIAWSSSSHASTLGVFGYGNRTAQNSIFQNQKVTYNKSQGWEYDPKQYWTDYNSYYSFDFFGYMVEGDLPGDAKVTFTSTGQTLSFSASFDEPVLISAKKTPLICHAPFHTAVSGTLIPFDMDQTLVAYNIQFQLGEKMDDVRYFKIKSVKFYGNFATSGTINRTYSYIDAGSDSDDDDAAVTGAGEWRSGDIVWNNLTFKNYTKDDPYVLFPDYGEVNVTSTGWVKWGSTSTLSTAGAFYVIPYTGFEPTIEVTYDVYADNDFNSDGSQITRKDVKSTIVLNSKNFANLTTLNTGFVYPIKIKIVPSYLYVLSDDDMTTGYLVAE